MQRLIRPNRRHLQTFNVELQRKLARLEGVDYQLCSIADKFIDHDLDLLVASFHASHLCTLFPRRQIDRQPFHGHRVHMHGITKKIHDAGAETKFRHTDNRLNSQLMNIGVGITVEVEPGAETWNPRSKDTWNSLSSTVLWKRADSVSITRFRKRGPHATPQLFRQPGGLH